MIVTVTPNPSIDRTVTMDGPLLPGEVHRISSTMVQGGGKGVNVSECLHKAGFETWALLPASESDPMVQLLHQSGVPFGFAPIQRLCRINLTIVADGLTTKINEPGPLLPSWDQETFTSIVHSQSADADWVVLSGSLSPAFPANWIAEAIKAWRKNGSAKIAVDSSGPWLRAMVDGFDLARPDLMAPNQAELDELGVSAPDLVALGVAEVLVTRGADGADLVTAAGTWYQEAFPVSVNSTVGAGDAALAGLLIGQQLGLGPSERLKLAVAYGSTAASLPGTQTPTASQVFASTGVAW